MYYPQIAVPAWMLTAEQREEYNRIQRGKFFLVKISGNDGLGETWRCRRCGGKHNYLTLMCIEQPFDNPQFGLSAYCYLAGASVDVMSPTQKARVAQIARALGQPNLATMHPETARRLATPERDIDTFSVSLGILEPISKLTAARLVDRINGKGLQPPLRLQGLEESNAQVPGSGRIIRTGR